MLDDYHPISQTDWSQNWTNECRWSDSNGPVFVVKPKDFGSNIL